ncbi:MAG: Tex family protein [Thermoflexibacter sp.]
MEKVIDKMMDKNVAKIAEELNISTRQAEATITLLDEGSTVPFISRYRKEMTGSLDEVAITAIRDRINQLRELEKRRESILASLREMGKLTEELERQINEAETMSKLEDIYLPYKPKRRTRATIAKEKGLEPLAEIIFAQAADTDMLTTVLSFIDEEKGVKTIEEALAGARDIIAEKVSEDQTARAEMRQLFTESGKFRAKVIPGKEEEGQKYKDYFDLEENIADAPSHRILAMRRAEKEGIISLEIAPDEELAIFRLNQLFLKDGNEACTEQVTLAIKDGYKRLLAPSMETEIRLMTKQKADEEAIKVFTDNVRQLLLASPLGEKRVLALDPGFRTGCKVVCLDQNGKLLHHDVIYPNEPQRKVKEAGDLIKKLCEVYEIQAIAIGNGTASRETETFIRALQLPKNIQIVMVNESGASVYSASAVAREEFPDYDVTVRGAVSIGRRLMDPLAELVKIDPKSIGVGQYQHDVDQTALKNSLDDTVISCVNLVGVEVNTASKELLMYVSGLGPTLAQNIVDYRNLYGAFKSREDLKKVPKLGAKTFEQCAGFLRIRNAQNPLDTSAVHPESYEVVEKMAQDLQATVKDLMTSAELRQRINLQKYANEKIGLPTLQDIMQELAKPGRDPREQFEFFSFADGVEKIEDLRVGMKLPGIVTNVTDFGAFVDIGVHQDGLVHISQMSDKYIAHPNEVLKVQQKVMVTVLEVDVARKRISLGMKGEATPKVSGKVQDKKGDSKDNKRKGKEVEEEDMQAKLQKLKALFAK